MRSRHESPTRTRVEIDGHVYPFSPESDPADLMVRIETVARSEPAFVTLSTGDSITSVLVTRSTRVAVYTYSSDLDGELGADLAALQDWDI